MYCHFKQIMVLNYKLNNIFLDKQWLDTYGPSNLTSTKHSTTDISVMPNYFNSKVKNSLWDAVIFKVCLVCF